MSQLFASHDPKHVESPERIQGHQAAGGRTSFGNSGNRCHSRSRRGGAHGEQSEFRRRACAGKAALPELAPQFKTPRESLIRPSDFGLLSAFGFRPSDLGLQPALACPLGSARGCAVNRLHVADFDALLQRGQASLRLGMNSWATESLEAGVDDGLHDGGIVDLLGVVDLSAAGDAAGMIVPDVLMASCGSWRSCPLP